jgi:beta-glucosidase
MLVLFNTPPVCSSRAHCEELASSVLKREEFPTETIVVMTSGGNALAEILFGDVNPSGKLPVTFERYAKDNPTFNNYYPTKNTKTVVYDEGVFVGYRGYEHNKITPRFPFGYGLSYTSFSYSGLNIQPVNISERKGFYEVTFTVKNTGRVQGAEVAEIYVGEASPKLSRPGKELKGFSKVNLRPGES